MRSLIGTMRQVGAWLKSLPLRYRPAPVEDAGWWPPAARSPAWRERLRHAVVIAALAAVVVTATPVVLIAVYRFVDPPMSMLMLRQALAGGGVRQQWIAIDRMSPHLPVTVAVSEDVRICRHWGVDWQAVEAVWDRADEWADLRGTSTIAMQTVKNLFLWNGRSYVRKLVEVPLAYVASLVWPKRRLMEIYLNIAEWGPGLFGAEAAARFHFGKSAADLTAREAALLAAALPNPHVRHAGRAGPRTRRLAEHLRGRAAREAQFVACITGDRG